jgi:hypothetical protein
MTIHKVLRQNNDAIDARMTVNSVTRLFGVNVFR